VAWTDLRHRGFIAPAGQRRVKIVDRHGLEEGNTCQDMNVQAARGTGVVGSFQ